MAVDPRQPILMDITVVAGDDYSRSWIVTETAVAYVHSGATIATVIESAGTAVVTNFASSFATVGSDTVLTYSLTDTETTTLAAGLYRWSLKVTKSGITQSWLAGQLQVLDREFAGKAGAGSTATTLNLTTSTGTALALTVTAAGASMTAAEILTSIKTVDGAGSGLDADLLDGNSSAFFATATGLSDHLADASDAHDASAISFAATGTIAATDAQAAIAEVATDAASALSTHEADTTSVHGISDTSALETTTGSQAKVDTHVNDTTAAHAASAVSFSAVGTIAGTDVQTAVAEVATDAATALSTHEADTTSVHGISDTSALETTTGAQAKVDTHVNDTSAAHAASAISFSATGSIAGTDVQTAIAEVATDYIAADALKLSLVAGGAAVENLGAVEHNVNTVAATGATETLDTSVYAVHDCTMDQACTFTFSNPAPSGKLSSFVLILRGAQTPTLPASVDWGDATPPTYTTPSMYTFTTVDAGTTWIGAQVAKAIG